MSKVLDELAEVVRMQKLSDETDDRSVEENEDLASSDFLRRHHATIADMAKRLEAAERAAARYRWLRDDPPLELSVRRFPGETPRGCYLDGYALDQAIDVAMKEPGEWTEGVG